MGSVVYHSKYWRSHRVREIRKPVYVQTATGHDGYSVKTGSLILYNQGSGPMFGRVLGWIEFADEDHMPKKDRTKQFLVLGLGGSYIGRTTIDVTQIDRILSTEPTGERVDCTRRLILALLGELPSYATILAMDEYGSLMGSYIEKQIDPTTGSLLKEHVK